MLFAEKLPPSRLSSPDFMFMKHHHFLLKPVGRVQAAFLPGSLAQCLPLIRVSLDEPESGDERKRHRCLTELQVNDSDKWCMLGKQTLVAVADNIK